MSIQNNNFIESFFLEYEEKNPILILFYIIISFGFYVVYWFYQMNKSLEILDSNSPDSNRAASVLLILPSLWFLIFYLLKKFIFHIPREFWLKVYYLPLFEFTKNQFSNIDFIISFIEIIGWFLILILILKYILDFSISFSDIVNVNFIVWYVFLSSYVFGFTFFIMGFPKLMVISFLTIIIIPIMQEKFNNISNKFKINSQKKLNYMFGSNG